MPKSIDLTGKRFGAWLVLSRSHGRYWRCQCLACKQTIKDVHASSLTSGASTSCGCLHKNNKLQEDLTGRQFDNWKVLGYAGNGKWNCECQCENHTKAVIERANLLQGKTKSCGCLKSEIVKNTLLARYGETSAAKVSNTREQWQIDTLNDKDKLEQYINETFKLIKPTFQTLANSLGVSRHRISVKIHKYNLENLVDINPLVSNAELELHDFIRDITDEEVVFNTKSVIAPYELDIYIPEKRLAIEFNGTYWHSLGKVDKYYHQRKTLACAEKGIQLIHVFEYEWNNEAKQQKIKNYLRNKITKAYKVVYARNTEVKIVGNDVAKEFYNINHLQGGINSEINLALVKDDEVLGMMSFGSPRFNNAFEYELTRLCFKDSVIVVGGSEKLFKHFINRYKPTSVISYCDLSKFSGNTYKNLGFSTFEITEPNYVWVNTSKNEVLPRYKTQKHKLIKLGYGNESQTEDEIMEDLGYYKVYDSGNLRMTWKQTV